MRLGALVFAGRAALTGTGAQRARQKGAEADLATSGFWPGVAGGGRRATFAAPHKLEKGSAEVMLAILTRTQRDGAVRDFTRHLATTRCQQVRAYSSVDEEALTAIT